MEMGSPEKLTETQVAHLNELARDSPESDKAIRSDAAGTLAITIPMNSNDIVLLKLARGSVGDSVM